MKNYSFIYLYIFLLQFRDRLRQAHVAFLDSLRELESVHTGRLEKNEELFLRLRKILVPRVARLALESTSLKDMILYGNRISSRIQSKEILALFKQFRGARRIRMTSLLSDYRHAAAR